MRRVTCATLVAGLLLASSAEPIRWMDGSVDESGRPEGRLLSDNPRWFGDCLFTGVTYEYESPPTKPLDIVNANREKFGRRLLDGDVFKFDAHFREVGRSDGQPIVALFDFRRPCAFAEVDVVSRSCGKASGFVEFSSDKTNWVARTAFVATSTITRVRFGEAAKGRFLRLSFKADGKYTALDEVYAWGDGESSDAYPEAVADIPLGDALQFSSRRDGGVSVIPMQTPYLSAKPTNAPPHEISVVMTRSEIESRYFAVVNEGGRTVDVRLTAPDFGPDVQAQLLIGGVVRMTPPERPLSQLEMVQQMMTGKDRRSGKDLNKIEIWPYLSEESKPCVNFCRRYLANYRQVVGFPDAIPLAPGEGCVLMLRVRSEDAKPSVRQAKLVAGAASLSIALRIADVTLPPQSAWIYACRPFTQQRPFESTTRRRRDVARVVELGVTVVDAFPDPGTKAELFYKSVPGCFVLSDHDCLEVDAKWMPEGLYRKIYKGSIGEFGEEDRQAIADSAHRYVRHAKGLGIPMNRLCLYLPDEPGRRNMRLLEEMCRIIKKAEPDLLLHMNPCFWEKNGLPTDADIDAAMGPFYNELVDLSDPLLSLVDKPLLRKYWTAPRFLNLQFIHPARRAGRMMSYSGHRNGFGGFLYYCYYEPSAVLPWDIRTWSGLDYMYQMAFPLENDVAITPIYESMREAAEDWRLLEALKSSGKDGFLKMILDESVEAWDRTDYMHQMFDLRGADIQDLRNRIINELDRSRQVNSK